MLLMASVQLPVVCCQLGLVQLVAAVTPPTKSTNCKYLQILQAQAECETVSGQLSDAGKYMVFDLWLSCQSKAAILLGLRLRFDGGDGAASSHQHLHLPAGQMLGHWFHGKTQSLDSARAKCCKL